MGKLSAAKVRSIKEPGRYSDGDGLMLLVDKSGARRWVLRIVVRGRRRDIGLGRVADINLKDARELAHGMRAIAAKGGDPIAERKRERESIPDFEKAARSVYAEHRPSWKNEKHAAQWISTLERYVFPKLGQRLVSEIEAGDIRDVLATIWLTKPETARRVRQRIGTVLDYCYAKGWRDHEAPVRAVTKGLPKQPKRDRHFEAMRWQDIPDFVARMPEILSCSNVIQSALRFLILTAARSGEVRGATWNEIDLEKALWTIPADRMKANRAHRVPLSEPAMLVLEEAKAFRRTDSGTELLFPGERDRKSLSDMSLSMPIRRANLPVTVHGFRSGFRDWCGEATTFPRELAERALAHVVRDAVEAAYARSDLLERRVEVMESWGRFVQGDQGNVVNLAAAN
ncbi:MAG: integrase arm-type DNA-binding domain-containing protein [Alphaproteobacteria bacterium]